MTNREFYKEKILDVVCNGLNFGVRRSPIEVIPCSSMSCAECEFLEGNCELGRKKWCNEEHDEVPKLTKNEKRFLNILSDRWQYIARDVYWIYLFSDKPVTVPDRCGQLCWCGRDYQNITMLVNEHLQDVQFNFIKASDKKPWKISKLKKLEVIE